jgi:hypothetical protein
MLLLSTKKIFQTENQPIMKLPIPDVPNIRIHSDLFVPMVDANKKISLHPLHH